MNYFFGVNLGSGLTGIEKAQFNRLNLFNVGGMSAKCVYMKYNNQLHHNAISFSQRNKCFTMYDYFQLAVDKIEENDKFFDWLEYWQDTCHYRSEISAVNSRDVRIFNDAGVLLMYAHFLDDAHMRLDYINYFDATHVKIRREFYDSRGFLSRVSYLVKHEATHTEAYLDPQGVTRLIKQFDITKPVRELRTIILKDYHDRDYVFHSEQELQVFFFKELYVSVDVYFCDRNAQLAPTMSKVAGIPICAVFHSTHVKVGENVLTGRLKSNYLFVLENPEYFTRIIVSTNKQKKDLIERFPNLPPVEAIPVGVAKRHTPQFGKRRPNRIISVARYSPEKQLLHQLEIINRLKDEFPNIELHLFGFGHKVGNQMAEFIKKNQLEKHVFMRGFLADLSKEFEQASLALMTSLEEGFSLATLEAESYGVPVIGYRISYGPDEIIENGVNGYLVAPNEIDSLYDNVRKYLLNPEMQKKLMIGAYDSVGRYTSQPVIAKWQQLVDQIVKSL